MRNAVIQMDQSMIKLLLVVLRTTYTKTTGSRTTFAVMSITYLLAAPWAEWPPY